MTSPTATWSAGAARLPFPVAPGTPLGGYAARTGSATGTRDPLTIGALVLELGENRLAIVAADVIAVDAALAEEIAAASGLNRAELALCASHTHSGPAGVVPRLHPADPDRLDPELRSRFVTTAANAIEIARRKVEPVELLAGQGMTDGIAANRNDPAGPHDARLSVLATRLHDGSMQALVAHFACHPTILGGDNRAVSADFSGALRRALATLLESDDHAPVVLFVNGAAGDVSTRFMRRAQDFAEVERVGTSLAETARQALAQARPLPGPLRHARATLPLSPRTFPPSDANAAHPAFALAQSPPPQATGQRRIAETQAQGAAMLAALAALPDATIPSRMRLDAWSLGGFALVTVPGELFASLGQTIGAAAPERTLVLGYANGYAGYLPDRAAYDDETYEALASPFAPGAGEQVASAAARLVTDLVESVEVPGAPRDRHM